MIELATPSVQERAGEGFSVYEKAVKELVALAENDEFARKVDNGPLGEARGKDTWQLHIQLRMLEDVNNLLQRHAETLQHSLGILDQHVHDDESAVADLVQGRASQVLENITQTRTEVLASFEALQASVTQILNEGIEEIHAKLQEDLKVRLEAHQEAFARLIDRRFNQTDVAFASVRADVEVVKSLLTDIIKARIGRSARSQD